MELENQHLISTKEEDTNRDKVPLRLQVAFGVGHVLNDICSSIWFTYLLVFLHLVLKFDNWEAGFLLLVGQIADAVANPFVGYQSDQHDSSWFCRYGKRKIWHLLGSLCIVTTIPFVFAPSPNAADSHKWAQMFYFSVFVVIFQFGWAAVQISHLSLIPELTSNDNYRTKLAAMRYCCTVMSNVFVYLVTWYVFGSDEESFSTQIGPKDAPKFQIIIWSGLIVGAICTVIFHVFIKEEENVNNNERTPRQRQNMSDIFCSFEYYQAAIIYMSTMLFVNLCQVFIPLYLHETLDMSAQSLAIVPLIIYTGSFLTSLIVERLNRYFGRKIAYLTGASFGLTACIWIQVRSESEYFISTEIGAVAVFIGIASSIILVTNLGITSDVIGNKTGSGAFIYGIMCFSDKLGNGIAVFLIQNFHKDYPTKMYYRDVITYVCGGAILLGTLFVMLITKKARKRQEYTRLN